MEKKLTTFKLINYDFAAAYLDIWYCFIDGDANMNNSGGRKRIRF